MKTTKHHALIVFLRTVLLIGLCFLLSNCAHDGRFSQVGAAVHSRVDVGVGVTKSTDGWWYFGGKIRGKRGKGSDAEESEPEWETPLIIPEK